MAGLRKKRRGDYIYQQFIVDEGAKLKDQYRLEDFRGLPHVIDIVTIDKVMGEYVGANKLEIITSWTDWFRKKDCPFLVIETKNHIKVWKAREDR